jgi:hypothetical protein
MRWLGVSCTCLVLIRLGSLRCAILPELDERLCRNTEPAVQTPDHFERQRTPAVEYLVHAIAAADERDEVARLKPILLHVIFDRFYRIWKVEWIMFPLPGLDQRSQNIKSIAFGGVAFRHHQALDFLEDAAVIALSFDRFDVHDFAVSLTCERTTSDLRLAINNARNSARMAPSSLRRPCS